MELQTVEYHLFWWAFPSRGASPGIKPAAETENPPDEVDWRSPAPAV